MFKIEDLKKTPKSGFSTHYVKLSLSTVLTNFAAKIAREKIALHPDELKTIKAAKGKAKQLVDKHFSMIEKNFLERQKNLLRYTDIQFTSLGLDCFSRTLTTRWGLKPPSALGEASGVFDLAIQSPACVRKCLEEDFQGYVSGLEMEPGRPYPINKHFDAHLVHDRTPNMLADDLALLRDLYRRRIDNFRQYVETDKPTLFVMHTFVADDEVLADFLAIRAILLRRRRGKKTAFFWMHTPEYEAGPSLPPRVPEDTAFSSKPYPFKGYKWHEQRHTFSQRGVVFERALVEDIKETVDSLGWVRLSAAATAKRFVRVKTGVVSYARYLAAAAVSTALIVAVWLTETLEVLSSFAAFD